MAEMSKETIAIMAELLAKHYIDGDVPMPIVELIEEALGGVGRWFPPSRAFASTPNARWHTSKSHARAGLQLG
jgi:hypothetical protein